MPSCDCWDVPKPAGGAMPVTTRGRSAVSMTCWASSLRNCGGGMSREHIISRSQFDVDSITLHGLLVVPRA